MKCRKYPTGSGLFKDEAETAKIIAGLNADLDLANKKVKDREDDNANLRAKGRELRAEIDDLTKKLPTDGSVSLSKEDALLWAAYQQLGKPEELKKKIEDADKVAKDLEALSREETLKKAAEATNLNLEAFREVAASRNLEIELGDMVVKEGDETKTVVIAYTKNKDGAKIKLEEYVEAELKAFLPALRPANSENEEGDGQGENKPNGTTWVAQTGGNDKKTPDLVEDFVSNRQKARDSVTNPLLPKPAKV